MVGDPQGAHAAVSEELQRRRDQRAAGSTNHLDARHDADGNAGGGDIDAAQVDRVGVGGSQNLDVLAWNGGTDKAIVVDTVDPTKTRAAMLDALARIRGTIGCDFPIPSANEPIDPFKVNVTLSTDGQSSGLAYDPSCGTTSGWHYDAPDAPHRIVLCPTTCAAARADAAADLEVTVGCATKTVK